MGCLWGAYCCRQDDQAELADLAFDAVFEETGREDNKGCG